MASPLSEGGTLQLSDSLNFLAQACSFLLAVVFILAALYAWSQQSYVWALFLLIGTGYTIFRFIKVNQAVQMRISEITALNKMYSLRNNNRE